MDQHPNASAAGVSGAVAVVVIALLGALGVAMSPIVSAAASSLVIAAVLLIGAKGFKGALDKVWKGSGE